MLEIRPLQPSVIMAIPQHSESFYGHNEFATFFLDAANISVGASNLELGRIPAIGGCVIVANRLFGPADPILLIKAISEVRPDLVVLTSYDFSQYPALDQNIHLLNMNEDELSLLSQVKHLLDQGLVVILFPAKQGTISRITANMALDKRWHPKLMRVLFQLQNPILPVYLRTDSLFSLVHSKTFSFDRLSALFQDMNASEKKVTLRVGKPLDRNIHLSFSKSEVFGRYLRSKLYALGSPLAVNSFFRSVQFSNKKLSQIPVAPAIDPSILEQELKALPKHNRLLQQGPFSLFLTSANSVPMALKEIGRQRELTFREVGEGTGDSLDLDEYDMYYHQLILWDHENKKIAGGYRLGFGHEIMELYGKRGFYLHSLFKFRKPFNRILEQSIELGRSYVTPEYQKARLPLFLLWKGILAVLLQNQGYRYLIGPVSISNEYSSFSRQLIVGFIKKFYWNSELAQHIKPRKAFEPSNRDLDMEAIMDKLSPEMKEIDRIIEEVEPKNFKLPVLIKKYIKQEARIIGFNLDPSFSNVLDGLIVLDMMDMPIETLENLKRDLN